MQDFMQYRTLGKENIPADQVSELLMNGLQDIQPAEAVNALLGKEGLVVFPIGKGATVEAAYTELAKTPGGSGSNQADVQVQAFYTVAPKAGPVSLSDAL